MKLLCLSPAEFIHFGTTRELRSLVTKDVQDYEFLDWKMQVNSAVQKEGFAAHNAYVGSRAKIGKKEQLHERLHGVFQDSGVDVWDCELLV